MSFRGRLTLFFGAIVVLPMIVVALLVLEVSEDSRDGKADARLATGLEVARSIYDEALLDAPAELSRIANLDRVAFALQAENRRYLGDVATREIRRSGDELVSLRFFEDGGEELASAGAQDAIAVARAPVELPDRGVVGEIAVGALEPSAYVARVAELTGASPAIVTGEQTLATTPELDGVALPTGDQPRTVETADETIRTAALSLDGAPPDSHLVLAVDEEPGFAASQPVVLAVLAGFVALATLLIIALARTLQSQIASMLQAARRIGEGDFSEQVPVEGNDEMAGLAREFNKMSDRLSTQMGQLRRQRMELDQSVRRIGEAFASGLDRASLLQIVLETGLSACEAESGRLELRGLDAPDAVAGASPGADAAAALAEAAREAIESRGLAEVEVGEARAIAHPLPSAGDPAVLLGSMALARRARTFGNEEKEVLRYLVGQAAVSVENVGLHEQVAEQAVTDELTGLANNRHFREWMDNETQRIGRFGGELSLVLLDIDNFKEVNDTYGHPQGDEALREVGRILQLESRGIDEPARYGGEEFVLALPETPKEGAIEVAERVRKRIESARIGEVDGNRPLRVTASLGVATMPGDGVAADVLVAAADAALYTAKRGGKNRVVPAGAR